jgi:prefoldin subunit 5
VTERREDLEASLAEIDRKLRDLQAELHVVATPEPAPVAPAEVPPLPPPEALPGDRLAELAGRVEGLRQMSAELEDATRALRDQLGS